MTAPLLKNDGLQQAVAGDAPGPLLGVLSEGYDPNGVVGTGGDQRVSIVPATAAALIKEGYRVAVENNAGCFAGFSDQAYAEAGCSVMVRSELMRKGDVFFAIQPPVNDFPSLTDKVVISWVSRLLDTGKAMAQKANASRVTLIDVTAVPRITIAQKCDVLSSQAKVAGHRAVVEAAHAFGRFHSSEMTAAGKYPPSQTFVLGCGVAGLAAIGTSKALGSVVKAWDVRDVSDQCASMGAGWVRVDFKEDGAGAGGYAKESSDAFKQAQQETFERVLAETDIAITTAAIPGKRSPLLITKKAVEKMKPGSVIVDLAAVGGGNCELTKLNEAYCTPNNVTIIGYSDLPARMANQSSAMYGQNMINLLKHIHGKEKAAGLLTNISAHLNAGDSGDIVTRSIVCCRNGELIKMPPPPQPTAIGKKAVTTAPAKKKTAADPFKAAVVGATVLTLTVLLMLGLGEGVKTSLLTTFLLAGAAGYQAVWGVAHALHTPLMSVTNAISGMTLVGGLLLLHESTSMEHAALPVKVLAMVAILFSTTNIVGGFIVSQRMLNLFKKAGEKDFSALMLTPGVILVGVPIVFSHRPELIGAVNTISSLLCVAAIGGLASMSTANMGCKFGIIGVAGALSATFAKLESNLYAVVACLMAVGGLLGIVVGKSVSPIALPQTVAAFHSLVGLAAMCTSIGSFAEHPVAGANVKNIAALLGDFIGGVTLIGSIIAFGKLNGNLKSKALNLPGKNYLNLACLIAFIILSGVYLTQGDGQYGVNLLWIVSGLSMFMGFHLVASVGGGDMPVCITVLNSYSGWALVAEGFLLDSTSLTIVGSLIGFSGAILTKIMCDAMNRDILNVLFGGINVAPPAKKGDEAPKEHVETSVEATAELLVNAKEVLVVPGYGMAMARAQTAMGELAAVLRNNKINMKFGVHPVAGRMPGQMNVLLAEASVPHDWVLEMDEVNPDMENNDVVLVVGANDVVNSAAIEVEGCAIWGMPVIEVWRAKKVIFCKRSMAGGYADLDNPVFYKENTEMLLGDAKKTSDSLAAKVRERLQRV
jgi:NAD(P) transhydrogenase